MSNVLSEEKRQQVVALGRLGWPLRRIEEATGVRRETAGGYLRAAGLPVRSPGRWGHGSADPEANPAKGCPPTPDAPESNPAKARPPTSEAAEVPYPGRSPTTSACEAHRDFVELSLLQGRNAVAIWQDLVDHHWT